MPEAFERMMADLQPSDSQVKDASMSSMSPPSMTNPVQPDNLEIVPKDEIKTPALAEDSKDKVDLTIAPDKEIHGNSVIVNNPQSFVEQKSEVDAVRAKLMQAE